MKTPTRIAMIAALATLTLEVYYRYLPMRQQPQTQKSGDAR